MDKKISFDYSKLKGRIKEKCGLQKVFAEKLGITEATMTSKLNGDSSFTQMEICKACEILEISFDKISVYFFTQDVRKVEQ